MDFYKRLVIKILERTSSCEDLKILEILKSGYDLSQKERQELEDIINYIV